MRRIRAPLASEPADSGSGAPDQPGAQRARFAPPNGLISAPPPVAARQALAPLPSVSGAAHANNDTDQQYFTVLYTKRSNKKRANKSFADGVLEVASDCLCTLLDKDGKVIAKSRVKDTRNMPSGAEVALASWEVEVDSPLDAQAFRSGACFMRKTSPACSAVVVSAAQKSTGFRKPAVLKGPATLANKAALAMPHKAAPLHDSEAVDALVLNAAGGGNLVSVVVDPYICRHLRAHQREGVAFMYSRVHGQVSEGQNGAILADAMGLGKTLQVIALLWTLLRQGPAGRPAIRRAIVATPSSLTGNWAAEVRKWLGDQRLRAMVLLPGPGAAQQVTDFKHGTVWKLLIVSYETLRKFATHLAGTCDLLVCDEGHRLKSAGGNKTIEALVALRATRRILLTGTPLQNNLEEFYAMVSFACPDLLGSLPAFRRVFAEPISRARDRGASAEERALGSQRSAELARRVEAVVLRRTADVNARFLPPLTKFVVFCRPSPLQVQLYEALLRSKAVSALLTGGSGSVAGGNILGVITALRKLCNHPDLLLPAGDVTHGDDEPLGELAAVSLPLFPPGYARGCPEHSGKLAVLEALLGGILDVEHQRCAVVSSSTAALDIVGGLCAARGWGTVRIDGATPAASRQEIVDAFNLYSRGQVCLLSAQAGGAGLNLIGANRLILLDSNWNPAIDAQAMARVWRDGQKLPCTIYRLLLTGTLDEKVYQRQLMKGELADAMEGGGGGAGKAAAFTREELRRLFRLDKATACETAALLHPAAAPGEWEDVAASADDGPLREAIKASSVTFVHRAVDKPDELADAAGAGEPHCAAAQDEPGTAKRWRDWESR
ncbi:hypothetical protein WJX81_000343 [Elliptochloris bilobata]|uniref:Uncharacterized protein n=1 Tax=Elliptochloris bilobata TaxID=381761 RepID=A0AAW1QMG8_9CHLO